MNNIIIKILGFILALSVVGGSAYYYLKVKETRKEYSSLKVSEGKISSNFLLPENRKCRFENITESQFGKVTIRSTMYISGDNVSTESEIDAIGKVTKSNIVIKDNITYMWSSASNKIGIKIMSKAGESLSDSYKKSVERVYTSCMVWSVDDSVFILPAEIEFKDLGK